MIGLEFNEKFVKVAEVKDTPQGLTLTRYNIATLPPKTTGQDEAALIGSTIHAIFKETGIFETEVHAMVSGPKVQVRRLTMPPMPETDLREAVVWEAKNFATFPAEGAVINYHLLQKTASKETRKLDLLVAVIERKVFEKTLSIIAKAGLRCSGITIAPYALTEALRGDPAVSGGKMAAVLNVGLRSAELVLIKDNTPQFVRQISLGNEMPNEILSSFTYYREQFFEVNTDKLYFCGEVSDPAEFKGSLSSALDIAVEELNPLLNIRTGPKIDQNKLKLMASRLALPIGLALNKSKDMNFLKVKEKGPKLKGGDIVKSFRIPNLAIVGCLVLIMGFVLWMNLRLNASINKVKKDLDIKTLRLRQFTKFQERKAAYEDIKLKKIDVRTALGQIAKLLPKDTSIITLVFSSQKRLVTIYGESLSPDSVSEFMNNLDSAAEFQKIKLNEIKRVGKFNTFSLEFNVK